MNGDAADAPAGRGSRRGSRRGSATGSRRDRRGSRHPSRIAPLAVLAAGALVLVGCAGQAPADSTDPASGGADPGGPRGALSVAAAASLQPAFEELTAEFAAEHPGVEFANLSFDGSSALATQIIGGAPVDVFASADEPNMRRVVDAGLAAADPIPFARSTLQIAVAPGNPLGIASLADLADPTRAPGGEPPVVVTCAPEVPCGAAARTLLDRDGVPLEAASEEQNVTAVLTKVADGEADAGLVYRSDVLRSEGRVEGIDIPGADEAAGRYVIAPITGSGSPEAAIAFAEYLRGDAAQAVLARLGFDPA